MNYELDFVFLLASFFWYQYRHLIVNQYRQLSIDKKHEIFDFFFGILFNMVNLRSSDNAEIGIFTVFLVLRNYAL